MWYSQDGVDYKSIATSVINSNTTYSTLSNLNFSPLTLKSDLSGEKTFYFKITFHSSVNQSIRVNYPAVRLDFKYYCYDSTENFNLNDFGTTGLLYNKTPYKLITLDNKVYDTYYVYYNLSNSISAPVSGSIKYVDHTKLLIKEQTPNLIGNYVNLSLPFPFVYELSNANLKAKAGKGESSVIDGRLQIKNGILSFNKSRFFQIVVSPQFRDSYNYTYLYNFIPNYLGVSSTNLDVIKSDSGSFLFPVYCKSNEVKVMILNNSVFNCCLLGLEWEALYSARSKRIG